MEANAPEKLYISPTAFEIGEKLNHILTAKSEGDIEYIRTDAFIEKALAFIRNCTTYDGLGYKAKCVNIEDFVKYMEGE